MTRAVAAVALAALVRVSAGSTAPPLLRLSLPGWPAPLLLDARLRGAALAGEARQGALRGTVRLRRGRTLGLSTLAPGVGEARFEGDGLSWRVDGGGSWRPAAVPEGGGASPERHDAAGRHAHAPGLVILVGPTVTQGESDLRGHTTGQGGSPPARTLAEIEADVRRAGPSGFDPLPSIRALRIPALWLYGGNDMHLPTRLCVERLEPLEPGRDLSYALFPSGNHGLVETARGLNAEVARSDRFVPGLFTTMRDWLRARGIAP